MVVAQIESKKHVVVKVKGVEIGGLDRNDGRGKLAGSAAKHPLAHGRSRAALAGYRVSGREAPAISRLSGSRLLSDSGRIGRAGWKRSCRLRPPSSWRSGLFDSPCSDAPLGALNTLNGEWPGLRHPGLANERCTSPEGGAKAISAVRFPQPACRKNPSQAAAPASW